MSDFTHKENTGSVFKNDKKGNDKAPEYKGSANINGRVMDIALWYAQNKKGETYFSLKFQEPRTVAEITNNAAKKDYPTNNVITSTKGKVDAEFEQDDSSLPF